MEITYRRHSSGSPIATGGVFPPCRQPKGVVMLTLYEYLMQRMLIDIHDKLCDESMVVYGERDDCFVMGPSAEDKRDKYTIQWAEGGVRNG